MKKPEKRVIERWDWHECTKWVESLLGYDTRDTLSKFKIKGNSHCEYRDFWHLICETCQPHNGSEIYLWDPLDPEFVPLKPWQIEIMQCYLQEFGQGPYWVEW